MNTTLSQLYTIYLKHPVITKDSRTITKGCIYFSLSGENFNGNQFAEDAIAKGAAYAVVDQKEYVKDDRFLLVENCLKTLQDLARQHRANLNIPIIGITGSNGKTTTKELISQVLSTTYKTFATEGNYNNHIGVPLSILQIRNEHEMAVIEMGANHQGEIEFLCSISDPNYGLITNIGKAHLEGFGGIEGVKKGKSELYKHLAKRDSLTFVNQDDEVLMELARNNRLKTYGTGDNNDCNAILEEAHPKLKGKWQCGENEGVINAKIFGAYNFYNMLAAICIGNHFDITAEAIDRAINSYESDNNRSEIKRYKDHTIYLDAYNANPSSTKAAIDNFELLEFPKEDKVMILGDMFELGEDSLEEHQSMINYALLKEISTVLFVGENYYQAAINNKEAHCLKSTNEAIDWFKTFNKKAKHILIKGSRGMALEKLLK